MHWVVTVAWIKGKWQWNYIIIHFANIGLHEVGIGSFQWICSGVINYKTVNTKESWW